MNVLIVEDEPHIVSLLASCIQEAAPGASLFTTDQSAEAIQIALANPMDLFILDIQLADYKGTQLAKELRAMECYSFTPILFATGLANEELNAYRQIKCYGFLIKPFTRDEVLHAVRDVLSYMDHLRAGKTPQPEILSIEQKSHVLEYPIHQIVYVESFGKHLELHIKSAGEEIRSDRISGLSLKKIAELLGEKSFIQCHKSYIINTAYIQKIDKSEGAIKLVGADQLIPIGHTFKHALKNRGHA
ncbi:two component transcriptional regulator [Paenibacillus algicola]|uniref:Two component transcriptional regulator n=1 Tax=Paenibacillus algicola TaxID=2565926 RepID=A0A4P8XN82_9BACL|nr:LytTR family DNA-binding domain-containing protein [Paenibacillus algicola]QCT04018.1 two component transcriptional regulator [Paenibacillus algicola]